jgi:hypothetical protein
MGAWLRAHRWADSPLAPPERGPRSLKTAIRTMRTSRQPTAEVLVHKRSGGCRWNLMIELFGTCTQRGLMQSTPAILRACKLDDGRCRVSQSGLSAVLSRGIPPRGHAIPRIKSLHVPPMKH